MQLKLQNFYVHHHNSNYHTFLRLNLFCKTKYFSNNNPIMSDDNSELFLDPFVVIDLGMFRIIIPQASSELILMQTINDTNLPLELKKKNIRYLIENGVDINFRNPYKVSKHYFAKTYATIDSNLIYYHC